MKSSKEYALPPALSIVFWTDISDKKIHHKIKAMQHKKELDELYRQKKEKIDAYLKTKNIKPADRQKHDEALSEWEKAWAKYMDVIVYLEGLEI